MSLTEIFHNLRSLDKSENPADQAQYLELRNRIIIDSAHLVTSAANAFIKASPMLTASNDLDDLVSEATIGLILAVDRFDPAQGVLFSTYAAPYIKGKMQHYIRDRFGLKEIATGGGSGAGDDDAVDPDNQYGRADVRNAVKEAFLAVEAALTTDRARQAWNRSKWALEMKYFEGKTAKEVGRALLISEQSACNLIARGLSHLRPHLEHVAPTQEK